MAAVHRGRGKIADRQGRGRVLSRQCGRLLSLPHGRDLRGSGRDFTGLGQYGKPVLINGGDVFVARAVLDAEQPNPIITGVNQECVFPDIDFDHRALVQQTENTNYYREYLDRCKYAGLDVYLLEYAKPNTELKSEIDDYCKQNGFLYYISPSIDLDAK